MFNAVLKIPMQFFILLLGTLVFVFYQFEPPPVYFNQVAWERAGRARPRRAPAGAWSRRYGELHAEKRQRRRGLARRPARRRPRGRGRRARRGALAAHDRSRGRPGRGEGGPRIARRPGRSRQDTDYVFITFILDHLPHGMIGLLVAAFFAATLSSKAAELNALALDDDGRFLPAPRARARPTTRTTWPPRGGSP